MKIFLRALKKFKKSLCCIFNYMAEIIASHQHRYATVHWFWWLAFEFKRIYELLNALTRLVSAKSRCIPSIRVRFRWGRYCLKQERIPDGDIWRWRWNQALKSTASFFLKILSAVKLGHRNDSKILLATRMPIEDCSILNFFLDPVNAFMFPLLGGSPGFPCLGRNFSVIGEIFRDLDR